MSFFCSSVNVVCKILLQGVAKSFFPFSLRLPKLPGDTSARYNTNMQQLDEYVATAHQQYEQLVDIRRALEPNWLPKRDDVSCV